MNLSEDGHFLDYRGVGLSHEREEEHLECRGQGGESAVSGTVDKEYRPLVKKLRRLGCEIRRGRKHTKILLDGQVIATVPSSGSDWRGVKNLRCQLRRKGLVV